MRRRSFLALALGALLPAGCYLSTAAGEDVVSGTGTVRWFSFEGGFFAIQGDDGVTYDPVDLAEEFRRDGLRVRYRVRIREDMAGFHMAGPIVEILEISRL